MGLSLFLGFTAMLYVNARYLLINVREKDAITGARNSSSYSARLISSNGFRRTGTLYLAIFAYFTDEIGLSLN